MVDSKAKPEIEFWFEFGSAYSYLSVMRIEREAAQRGVDVLWRPFLLGPIFQAVGFKENPLVEQKEKRSYVLRDMARQCQKYQLQWIHPSIFPRQGLLPLRVALLGAEKPWIAAFCREVMELNYGVGDDINDPQRLAPVLTKLGVQASEILEQAKAEPTKALLRNQTEEARARGIFGAPSFFVGTEMFWGNDRLDDALQLAANRTR